MLVLTMLAAWLTMVVAPGTPIGRALHAALVDRPARWLGLIRPGHLLFAAVVVLVAGMAIYGGGGDAAAMLSMGAPELVGWAAMVDIATVMDVAVALSVVAIGSRLRPVAAFMAVILRRHRPAQARARARQRRLRSRPIRHAANDDGDDRGSRYAVAA